MFEFDFLNTSPYEVLNVPEDATLATIRSAHRKLVLQCHPDRVNNELDKRANAEQFYLVQQAYEILSDENRRQKWDKAKFRAKVKEEHSLQDPQIPNLAASSRKETPRRKRSQRPRAYEEYHNNVPPPKMKRKPPARRGRNGDSYAEYSPKSRKDAREENRTHEAGIAAQEVNGKKISLRDTFKGVQGLINGINVDALADTGADKNFMSNHFAKEHEIQPRYFRADQRPSFLMGHGRTIQAVGQVEVSWKFRKELEKAYTLHFFVLPDAIFDVMIGGPFIYETETLAVHKDRLCVMPKPRLALHVRTVNFCGSPTRRLKGMIRCGVRGFQRCAALPDSGAEPNLLNYEYVKRNGWMRQIVPGPESCRLLMFADGSTASTEGQMALQWTFEKRWRPVSPQAEHAITFDVLDGCPVDVILGQDFLDESDVFTTRSDAFVDPESPAEVPGLNLVIRAMDGFSLKSLKNKLRKKKSKANIRRSFVEEGMDDGSDTKAVDEELQRRAEFDQKLFRAKNGPAHATADQQTESKRRSEWDKHYNFEIRTEAKVNNAEIRSSREFNMWLASKNSESQPQSNGHLPPHGARDSDPSISSGDDTPRDSSSRSTSTSPSDSEPMYLSK